MQERWEELNDGGNIIFGMRDHYAQDDEEIQKTWEDYLRTNKRRTNR